MKKILIVRLSIASSLLVLAGCAGQQGSSYGQSNPCSNTNVSGYPTTSSNPYPSQQNYSQSYSNQGYQSQSLHLGTVDRIEVIKSGDEYNIAGTLIGGVVGGLGTCQPVLSQFCKN